MNMVLLQVQIIKKDSSNVHPIRESTKLKKLFYIWKQNKYFLLETSSLEDVARSEAISIIREI